MDRSEKCKSGGEVDDGDQTRDESAPGLASKFV